MIENKNYFFKNRGRRLLILPFFLFLISFVSAAIDTNEVDNVYKVNTIVEYAKPCINNGTYCSASAVCNYTVTDPTGSIRINNLQATNQIAFHNISTNFDKLGIWTIDMMCCDSGYCGAETFYTQVTGDGYNDNIAFFGIILFFSMVVVGIGLWKRDAPITILGTFGLYFLGIYILINGIAGIRDSITSNSIGVITLGVAFYISSRATYELITG